MKRAKFQRFIALLLALTFLLSGAVFTVSAADESTSGSTSITDKTLAELKEELNAIKYDEYRSKEAFVSAPKGEDIIVIDAVQFDAESTDAEVKVEEYDGVVAIYTPAEGTISWKVNVPETSRYSIVVEYYPVAAKTSPIERVLRINGEVPFSEARYLTFAKLWGSQNICTYEVKAGEDAQTIVNEAAEVGIKATIEQKSAKDKKGNDITVTNVVMVYPEVTTSKVNDFINKYGLRFFRTDIDDNELRASLEQAPAWVEKYLQDSDGFYSAPFEFLFEAGENTISFESKNEPMAIKSISLMPAEEYISYEDYIKQFAGENKGSSNIKLEAEYPQSSTSQTIYPLEDRTDAANSPSSTKVTLLNTIGGEKWQISGQSIKYNFSVDESGLYSIAVRFKQNVLDGMSVAREISLYSDATVALGEKGYYDGIPFFEATKATFEYGKDWQSKTLGSRNPATNEPVDFEFYFKAGVVYTIEFKVTLGEMGDVIRRVEESLNNINADYLNILKLTGANPDQYRDYGFFRIMPGTIQDLYHQSNVLYGIAEEVSSIIGEKSSSVATLEKVAWLCDRMTNEDEIAKNLTQLKSYIGTLGTWITTAKTQPLQIDFFTVQSVEDDLPKAKAGFFSGFWHSIKSFWMSFFRNYDRMGASSETYDASDSIEVWLASGRDQAQIVRNLVNNNFTPEYGHAVNIKLVAAGTLLPSVLADMGPDVYIGLGDDAVINYAIRGALKNVENFEGFDETIENYNEAAMLVLGIEDAQGVHHVYGLPETQNFPMMFIRTDILADLNQEIPKTWDDILAMVPILQSKNMEIGLSADYKIFLYQMGGELFADGGMRINLDSNVALESFEMMCNMFTMYSFPYKYDFENRFRTGEMPIGIASYNGTYNKLVVFATEIRGLWTMVPLPGIRNPETGEINNVSVSSVSAIVMLTGCDNEPAAWDFMRWHAGADFQIKYSNEMIATIGPSAKHPTANKNALSSLDWSTEEYKNIALQFSNLASIPNYPGAYIIGRYTNFAFLAALNKNANPVDELQSYITIINKEITRKRDEFGLETLEIGQTLLSKRVDQANEALLSDIEKMSGSQETSAQKLVELIKEAIKSEDSVAIRSAAESAQAYDAALFADTIAALNRVADILEK